MFSNISTLFSQVLEHTSGTWVVLCGMFLVCSWVLNFLWLKFAYKLVSIQQLKGNEYIAVCFNSIRMPVTLIIFVIGIMLCFVVPISGLDEKMVAFVLNLSKTVVVFLILWTTLRVIVKVDSMNNQGGLNVENRTRLTTTLMLSRFFVYFLLVLSVGELLGYSLTGLLAFGSAGAIVVGLAAKTQIENALSFAVIRSNGKYVLGDSINITSLGVSGVVESMTLSSTFVRELDTTLVSVPNSLILTNTVKNTSSMKYRMVEVDFPVLFKKDDDVHLMIKTIKKMLHKDERVSSNQLLVNITEYNPLYGSMNLKVVCYLVATSYEQYFNGREAVVLSVSDFLCRMGIGLAVMPNAFHDVVSALNEGAQKVD
ncbi:mechanosensitive ion channel family protein [Pseudoalteromonas marina]|uniref:Mechanosensitive ion channel n=1 Tax=Pseudoalteromonas marina TaxID=267375 RepID=A0ABT9FC95_9GAMM|nr:mechanosensitive ion channel domain-containing protein [Pseudoalteromonas marina]MDP2564299.1 mechanosensitive ion channel [Pseudoalteromonas marina]